MNIADVITIGREALWVTMLIAGPLLGAVLIVGIIIGIFQAATSIQEMTLSFIPKLIVLVIVLLLVGGWQLLTLVDYFQRLLLSLPIYLQ
ncbi:MAG: flagellar biosynthesis protein FliQ [Porticoccaceae bacterium]|jgi:flagellar biosynthetic protein FliQ|uniref:Flagellar biosynthetic protein FliQ n=2 Tax=OM182 clade TaxID=745002 RepID=A0A0R2S4R9_9GAMM|nr:MAG: flagellar biosynthetic protein FliQ [OM182 bacterium BACL3 MAG-120507-bin80]KRO82409.1 MAG: flagellar biosynthetic protein FliQ [OM182 bacterium BACL3 MAG-120619-bin3]MDA8671574.1 flagellar biosynthesis protein FliQ [Gammaproteobacteria bacterium]MDP4744591.1 flagellar biosynthesis protein FliQ [Porticoccaceae bacterium]MDB4155085.1 flagellar biosynthesis protein FliQ [Gammaproteobacteria bacterium]|tara:strand:- start:194 stop:463 length:270 start_codon:yes stop_codon:yes gene_type:complete